MRNILAAIVGAIIVFVWGSISWTVLPWHHWEMKSFKNEGAAITAAIQSEATESGIYSVPNYNPQAHGNPELEKAWHEKAKQGPFVFLSVNTKGTQSDMKTALAIQFGAGLLIALLMVGLLHLTRVTNPLGGAIFVALAVTSGSFLENLACVNWWSFPINAAWVNVADVAIAWFIAGLLMTKIAKK